jgi:hypothetical protein
MTMTAILERCFGDEFVNIDFHGDDPPDTCLWVYSTTSIIKKFPQLTSMRWGQIRCLAGDHLTYDVQTIFDQPCKFFTILRNPVERVISHFYHLQIWTNLPCHPFIRDMTFEQYLRSGIGLDHDNHQVRMLCGCPELDSPWDPEGRPISTPPVERRHLEMAKRNIEERYVVAAPLEQFTALVWFFKRLYGWPWHRMFFRSVNKSAIRPRLEAVSEATRLHLATMNQYDMELYEWVKLRFARQIEPLSPNFSHELRRFELQNRLIQQIAQRSPRSIYPIARGLMFQFMGVPRK